MAEATLTAIEMDSGGGRYRKFHATLTGAASYATGGDTGVKQLLGVSVVKQVIASPLNVASQDYGVIWDDTNSLLLWATEGAQVSNATDVSALSFSLVVIGI